MKANGSYEYHNDNLLEDINNLLVKKHWWNILYIVICLGFGLIGNSVVIVVYHTKLRSKMEERFFIPILAVLDLLACVMVSVLMIVKSALPVMFRHSTTCRVLTYSALTTSTMALFMLAVIAFHRFLKIVRPFGFQMNIRVKRYTIAGVGLFSYFIFLPVFHIYRTQEVYIPDRNISFFLCSTGNSESSQSVIIFQGFLIFLYLVSIVTMAVLYFFVARTIRQRIKLSKRRKSVSGSQNIQNPVIRYEDFANSNMQLTKEQKIQQLMNNTNHLTETYDTLQLRRRSRDKRKGHFSMYKYSYIFMIITLKAVVSYFIPWILVIIKSRSEGPWTEQEQRLIILRYLFILSHITNPIIYGLLDRTFRSELKVCGCKFRSQLYVMNGSGSS